GEEPSLDIVGVYESERRILPAGRDLVVGRQRQRQLSSAGRRDAVGIPAKQERRQRAADVYLPPGRSGRRAGDRSEPPYDDQGRTVRQRATVGAEHPEPAREQAAVNRWRAALRY